MPPQQHLKPSQKPPAKRAVTVSLNAGSGVPVVPTVEQHMAAP
jgi:hypothetical protein